MSLSTITPHAHASESEKLAEKKKRVTLHLILTGSSRLNLVERFFVLVTDKAIRRGELSSVKDQEEKLTQFILCHKYYLKPFVWTKSVEVILEQVVRAKEALI